MRTAACLSVGLLMFTVTMLVYGLGIAIGAFTWCSQLISIVALNDLMVAAVLWMFWG